ncbi:MAG: M3 family metallopeptidase [Bacteroidales bacterium]|nr:M3 family metallopeptidase [Bacteroidales bacterium]
MKKILFIMAAISTIFYCGCKDGKQSKNPFFSSFDTPFQVPPFDKIDTTDYMPAFLEGINRHNAEIEEIVNNSQVPTFENTILTFDKSGKLLTQVGKVFYNMNEANTNKELQNIARKLSPIISKHNDDIMLNEKLFARIKKVYEKRNEMGLDPQQIRVVEKYFRDFERQGANLSPDKKEQLRKLNTELSLQSLTFGENLLAETNDNFKLVVDNKTDLEGLPQGVIDAAAETAKEKGLAGKWVFTLAKPSMIPFLQFAKNRSLREKIYRGYFMRGDNGNKNDNNGIVEKIVKLRAEKAQLLGYKSFAAYVIDDNMAKTPATVNDFLMKLWNAALPVAKMEVVEMQKIIDREGGKFKLAPWDWWYYAEIVRKEKFDLDENELKPYFSLQNVRDGMFLVANKLYGITFTKRTDLPVYQKDVETYEVKEADGKHLGILYLDYFPRDGKSGGAWCTDFLSAGWENGKRVDPVVSMVCNFTKPTGDTPSLLSWDETTTLFHEFGHALHGLFTEGKYTRTAGSVPQDYVEMPSQIMENWAGEPKVLQAYAKHYKTGAVIPQTLIDKIQKSGLFNQGFETIEYLAASLLDMDYHNLAAPAEVTVQAFEKKSLDSIGLIKEILPRYRTTYFAHIFDGGYAAGYYVYIWAAVLDADAFNTFKTSGDIYNKDLAAKFRKYCLAESGDDEGMIQYKKFRGQEPSIDPLLKKRGLK